MLQGFLDTIFFTCGMSFHNTCDLAMAVLPKQPDEHDDTEDENDKDQENIDEEDDCNENEPEDLDDMDEELDNNMGDSIHELFSRVFVNNSWSCASQVEKPYYSAGIYPDVCIECGSLEVNRTTKDEHPLCNGCGNNTISKKRLKWKQGGKGKRKQ